MNAGFLNHQQYHQHLEASKTLPWNTCLRPTAGRSNSQRSSPSHVFSRRRLADWTMSDLNRSLVWWWTLLDCSVKEMISHDAGTQHMLNMYINVYYIYIYCSIGTWKWVAWCWYDMHTRFITLLLGTYSIKLFFSSARTMLVGINNTSDGNTLGYSWLQDSNFSEKIAVDWRNPAPLRM